MSTVIRRKPASSEDNPIEKLTDADRYDIMRRYRLGEPLADIGKQHDVDPKLLTTFISTEIKGLSTIQESNKLIQSQNNLVNVAINPTNVMNEKFLADIPDRAETYAFYYAMTGSNEHALKESGLDKYVPKGVGAKTLKYTLATRGRYLRSLPSVYKLINEIRDQRIIDSDIGKPMVQSELIEQIEQLKELSADDPKYRGHLLKAIELLGKTIPDTFTDKIQIEDVSTKNGLELLMQKAKQQEAGVLTYEQAE